MTIRAKKGWTLDYLNEPVSGLLALFKWLVTGTGPMSALGTPGAAFIRTDDKKYVSINLMLLIVTGFMGASSTAFDLMANLLAMNPKSVILLLVQIHPISR